LQLARTPGGRRRAQDASSSPVFNRYRTFFPSSVNLGARARAVSAAPARQRCARGQAWQGAHFIPMRLRTFSFVEYAMTLEWCTGVSFCTICPVSSLLFGCTVFDCATPPARGQRPLAPCRRGAHGGAGRRRTFTFTPSTTTLPYFGSTCSCGALSAPGRQRVLPRSGLQRACGLQGAAVCKGPATAAVRAPWSPRPPSPCPCPR